MSITKTISVRRAGATLFLVPSSEYAEAKKYAGDDMKVVASEDGRLRAIGKRISEGVNAESIGLLAFRGDGAARFRAAIEKAWTSVKSGHDQMSQLKHGLEASA